MFGKTLKTQNKILHINQNTELMKTILHIIYLILILNAIVIPFLYGLAWIKLQTWQEEKEHQQQSKN